MRSFQKAIDISENYIVAYVNYANLCAKLKKYNISLFLLEKAKKINPNDLSIYMSLGDIFLKTNDLQQAYTTFCFVYNKDNFNIDALNNIGLIYFKKGNYEKSYFKKLKN